jgi:hypothetical protein
MLPRGIWRTTVRVILLTIPFICIGYVLAIASPIFQIIYLPFISKDIRPTPIIYQHPLISEVMVYPLGKEPDNEWIEIYHAGGDSINLGDFKIGDAAKRGDFEGMLRFPVGTIIQPGQVIVIANNAEYFTNAYGFKPDFEMVASDITVPSMIKYTSWASSNVRLTNSGDEVIILDENDNIIDAVSWGSSLFAFDPPVSKPVQGHSIERKPAYQKRNLALDFILQQNPNPGLVDIRIPTPTPTKTATPTMKATNTPTATPLPCGPAPLLITEVYYKPTNGDTSAEWIELFNAGDVTINLACIKVGDEEQIGGGEGMLIFPEGAVLAAGEVVVIANRATTFHENYGFLPDFEMSSSHPDVPVMAKYTQWSTGNVVLSDVGDDVLILDGEDNIVDAVSWGSSKFAFDPSVANVNAGYSIERYPADCDTNSATDWRGQPNPHPGYVDLIWPTPTSTSTSTSTPTSISSSTPTSTSTSTPTNTPSPPPVSGGLLISEVMYFPLGNEPENEWIEIYNAGDTVIDLSEFKVGDQETFGGSEGMLQFPFGTTIAPGNVIVIANQATDFFSVYGFLPDFEMTDSHPSVPVMMPYLAWADGQVLLGNMGDEVLILDDQDNIVDTVSWGTSNFAFDPPVPCVGIGHSIERFPANIDTNTNEDWIDQPSPNPGIINLSS